MPTNEERREVARKLREVANTLGGNMDGHKFAHYVADAVLGKESSTWQNLTMYLADIIEPEQDKKAKAGPFPIEEDTGYFDTTECECGYLNDVSATYCGQCGSVIEVVHDITSKERLDRYFKKNFCPYSNWDCSGCLGYSINELDDELCEYCKLCKKQSLNRED